MTPETRAAIERLCQDVKECVPGAAAQKDIATVRAFLESEAEETWDADDLAELHRMVPDLNAVLTYNPIHKVFFRAGLLACREYMARFVERGGSDAEKNIGASIRASWWPSLGDDPGAPRQLQWDEIADEKPTGRIDHKAMDPSVEALPYALAFIINPLPPQETRGEDVRPWVEETEQTR